MKRSLHIDFGNTYKEFSRVLRESKDDVIDSFVNTPVYEKLLMHYSAAIPQPSEKPMDFLLRNFEKSYSSVFHKQEQEIDATMARIAWYVGKIPLLRRSIRLSSFSTELYLDQKSDAIRDEVHYKEPGIGNDRFTNGLTRICSEELIDIDVGFHSTKKVSPNWFYRINTNDSELNNASENAYHAIVYHKNSY